MVKQIINRAPKIVQKALSNKFILYFVLCASVVHIIGYIQLNQWDALALFMATLVVMTYFSKNMIVNLGVALFLANCKVCMEFVGKIQGMVGLREGFKEGNDAKKYTRFENPDKKGEMLCKESGTTDVPKCGSNGYKCYNDDKCKKESFSGMKQKKGQLVKEAAPAGGNNDDDDEAHGKRMDYTATYEMAINNLDKMLGSKGMQGLTKETEKMINQQKGLMESLNTMQPVLESARKTLDGMNMPDIDQMSGLLEKMNGGAMSGLMATLQKGGKDDKK